MHPFFLLFSVVFSALFIFLFLYLDTIPQKISV